MSKEEAVKTFWMTLVTSVLFIVFGIFLLLEPNTTIILISRVITIMTCFIGIFGLYKYLTRTDKSKKFNINIIYSLVAFVIALIVYIYPTAITGLIPIALGLLMMVNALFKVGYLKHLKNFKNKDFGVCLLIFIFLLVIGIITILNPLEDVLTISQTIGMLLTFYAVLDLILSYLFKNNID